MKLKVLYISVRADWGGGPEHLFQLLCHSPKSLHAIVGCPDEPPYFSKIAKLPSVCRMIPIPHRSFSFYTFFEFYKAIKTEKIMLVHSHGKGAGLYSRLLAFLTGVPCVHTYHGVHVGAYGNFKQFMYNAYEKFSGLLTAKGIAVSLGERSLLEQLKYISSDRLVVIPNGVVIPDVQTQRPGVSDRVDVITITRFDFQKNTEFIIEVLDQLQQKNALDIFRFIFIGNGESRPAIENKITERWGESVAHFVGTTSEPGCYFEKCFCYFSCARWEGLPLAVLEAMSYGVPVVASRVVGNEDAVAHNGLLYNLNCPEQAADYLIELYNNKKLWQRCSRLSRKAAVEKYSVIQMANEVWTHYLQLMTQCAPNYRPPIFRRPEK